MGKQSRKKPIKPDKRKSGTLGFSVVIAIVMIIGVIGIVLSRGDDEASAVGPRIGDHWHAALGVNVCGEWKPNTPQYEAATGIHSHNDGFIHLHPGSSAGAGHRATLGLFFDQAGEEIGSDGIRLSDGTNLKNGDECPNLDNKPGKVRWSINNKEETGDPSRYVPSDGDIVAIAFLPEGEEIGVPPVAGQLPSDIPGGQQQQPPQDPEGLQELQDLIEQQEQEQQEQQNQDPPAESEDPTTETSN